MFELRLKPGMEGKWTPFALSNQKQPGHFIDDSTFPREISYGSGLCLSNVPLCLGILVSFGSQKRLVFSSLDQFENLTIFHHKLYLSHR